MAADPYRANRQLERKLFRGIPEHVRDEMPPRSLPEDLKDSARLIATVVYEFDEEGGMKSERIIPANTNDDEGSATEAKE